MSNARTVLVTGATSGIGLETARQIARAGNRVLVGARDAARGAAAVDELKRAGGQAELATMDVASFASVRSAAGRLLARGEPLDVLVNNAGIAARTRQMTADGHELTWHTNFLGGYLLTRLLLPLLRKGSRPRVVNVSSRGHYGGRIAWEDPTLERTFAPLRAYAQSKLAQVLFTRELARREPGILVNAVHPGAIGTTIWNAAPAPLAAALKALLPSAEKGARPVVRLAIGPDVEGVSGRFFYVMKERAPSAAALDDADAARLWELAEKATGLA